jgi:hypothetical protein
MIVNYIKKKLDEYLEFDSDLLFNIPETLIFGGSIRDAISGDKINDIDILINPKYFNFLADTLIQNGYIFNDSLTKKMIQEIYKDVKIISEPKTFFNRNGKIVQLIKPRDVNNYYIKSFSDLINNVDISCCALSYDGNVITEYFKDAYYHAKYKVYECNVDAIMYSFDRFIQRQEKMNNRGWSELNESTQNMINREKNIDKVMGLITFNKNYSKAVSKKKL